MATISQPREILKFYAAFTCAYIGKGGNVYVSSNYYFPGEKAEIINSRIVSYLHLMWTIEGCLSAYLYIYSKLLEANIFYFFITVKSHFLVLELFQKLQLSLF